MRPIFETSAETTRLHDLFRDMRIGERISFQAASKRLGFTVSSTLSAYHSARRMAMRDNGVVIEGIRGYGFTRINGTGMVKKGYGTMKAIRRRARHGSAVTEIAIRQNLTREEMIEATEQLSRFRIIETTGRMPVPRSNRQEPEEPPSADIPDARAALKAMHASG